MRRRQHSKSGLFLIELTITIAFFTVTTAIFLQVFVKSHTISQQADQLFHAQEMASCVAEIMGGTSSDASDGFVQELKTHYSRLQETSDGVHIYFDKDWNNCDAVSGQFVTSVFWQKQDEMWNIEITIEEEKKSVIAVDHSSNDDPIYALTIQLYCPQTGGES